MWEKWEKQEKEKKSTWTELWHEQVYVENKYYHLIKSCWSYFSQMVAAVTGNKKILMNSGKNQRLGMGEKRDYRKAFKV